MLQPVPVDRQDELDPLVEPVVGEEAQVLSLGLDFEELALPNLVADVDTRADLDALGSRGGARTRALVEAIAR